MGVETGFHRVPSALEPSLLTARALEDTRFVTGLEGALFAHPGGPAGAPFAGDAHCEVVTAWDVAAREEWLRARLELRFPVWVGLANAGPFGRRVLAGGDALGARAVVPVVTYRFGLEPLGPGTFTVAADGPLAGLAAGENRAWLQELLANHVRALMGNDPDPHREREDAPLFYAYGQIGPALMPENFTPYAILGMHPDFWTGPSPPRPDETPPHLSLETFGPSADVLHLAVRFRLAETMLDKLRA